MRTIARLTRMRVVSVFACCFIALPAVASLTAAADPPRKAPAVLFREGFEDSHLPDRGWYDGKLVVDRCDVVLRTTDFPNMKFNQFLLTPYFGPGLLPHEQTMWVDEVIVGTKRVAL